MDKDFAQTDKAIQDYVHREFHPEDDVLLEIRRRAEQEGLMAIHVGPMDGLHLEVIARAAGAKRIVEIGTLAGYSGVRLARALPPGGKLFTFEFSPKHAAVAKATFEKAGVADKTEIFIGSALDNLDRIKGEGPFDLVFIDADKDNYPGYFKWAAEHLRSGGVILADNTFAWGNIAADPRGQKNEVGIRALQLFNHLAATDPRFVSTILPTGEGLTMAVKK